MHPDPLAARAARALRSVLRGAVFRLLALLALLLAGRAARAQAPARWVPPAAALAATSEGMPAAPRPARPPARARYPARWGRQ